jgi:hypothetical protein
MPDQRQPGEGSVQVKFEKSKILKGLELFFGLSLASLGLVVLFTASEETWQAVQVIRPRYLAAAVAVISLDWLLSGLRLKVLARELGQVPRWAGCVRAGLANTFMGAVTPSQTGGGPAQIYVLYKEGLPLVEAMSLSLVSFLSTMFFLVLATATITFMRLQIPIPNLALRIFFRTGVTLFFVIGLLVILFVAKPGLLRDLTTAFFDFLSRFRRQHFLRPGGRAWAIVESADRCHQIMIHYFRKGWPRLLAAVMLTGGIFAAKFTSAYFIVRGLDVPAHYWDVIAVQILITLAIYFAPTPGASGVAELGGAVLMASIVPRDRLMIFVILWRAIGTYLAVLLGGLVILRAMGKEAVVLEVAEDRPAEKSVAL